MLARKLLLVPLTFLICSCSNPLELVTTKPVGVPFLLDGALRACLLRAAFTDPETIRTQGELKLAYGDEYTEHIKLYHCAAEVVALIDKHNDQMTSGKLAPK